MTADQSDDFHVRPGRVGSRGTRINPRGSLQSQPFLKQVKQPSGEPEEIPTGLGADRAQVKRAREEEPVGSMHEVVARKSFPYFFVRVMTAGGNAIPPAASGHAASRSRRGSSGSTPKGGSGDRMAPRRPRRRAGRSMPIFAISNGMGSTGTARKERPIRLSRTRPTARPLSSGAVKIGINSALLSRPRIPVKWLI